MTKKEAISIISRCSSLYESNLCGRQLVFVYRDNANRLRFVEVTFRANNFMHFTGMDTAKDMKAKEFYRSAIDKRLKESDIVFRADHTTELKLHILPNIMNIAYSARMIGDYTGPHIELYTEKVTGTTTACLGLIKNGCEYIPNTILKEDIRDLTPKPPGKIFAILRKQISQSMYSEITYQSKGLKITRSSFPTELHTKLDIF